MSVSRTLHATYAKKFQKQADEIEQLNARIKELEDGSCRFNCRTKKEAFIAGYLSDVAGYLIGNYDEWGKGAKTDAEAAYKEWLGER